MSELDSLLNNFAATDGRDDTKKYKTVEEVFQEIVAGVEIAEAEFVANFLDKMFAANYFARGNSQKVALYNILVAAVMDVALLEDDDSPSDKLETLIAQAEFWIFDEPNPRRFHDCVIRSFEVSKFRQFSQLAEALRRQGAAESRRRLAMRKTLKAW